MFWNNHQNKNTLYKYISNFKNFDRHRRDNVSACMYERKKCYVKYVKNEKGLFFPLIINVLLLSRLWFEYIRIPNNVSNGSKYWENFAWQKTFVVWIHDVGEEQKRHLTAPFLNIEIWDMFFYGSIGGKTVGEECEENLHFH